MGKFSLTVFYLDACLAVCAQHRRRFLLLHYRRSISRTRCWGDGGGGETKNPDARPVGSSSVRRVSPVFGARAGMRYIGRDVTVSPIVRPATLCGGNPSKGLRDFRPDNRNKCVVITVGRRWLVNGRRPQVVWRRRGNRPLENVSSSFSPSRAVARYYRAWRLGRSFSRPAQVSVPRGRISSFYIFPVRTAASRTASLATRVKETKPFLFLSVSRKIPIFVPVRLSRYKILAESFYDFLRYCYFHSTFFRRSRVRRSSIFE